MYYNEKQRIATNKYRVNRATISIVIPPDFKELLYQVAIDNNISATQYIIQAVKEKIDREKTSV